MNLTSEPETLNVLERLGVHTFGILLFIAGFVLLGLRIDEAFGSYKKLLGAAIFFSGCDELAESAWRALRRWLLRRGTQA